MTGGSAVPDARLLLSRLNSLSEDVRNRAATDEVELLHLVETLRNKHADYKRKQQAPFKRMVRRALSMMMTPDSVTHSAPAMDNGGGGGGGGGVSDEKRGAMTPVTVTKKRRRFPAAPLQTPKSGRGGVAAAQGVGAKSSKPGWSGSRRVRYSSLGGISSQLACIEEVVSRPLRHSSLYSYLGVAPPRGVLLHGPHGCGKTVLAHAIGTETGVTFLALAAPELTSGVSGDSEARLRKLFAEAMKKKPSIVFIDEIDAIAGRRDERGGGRAMEGRIVAQLIACMDQLGEEDEEEVGDDEEDEEEEDEEDEEEENEEEENEDDNGLQEDANALGENGTGDGQNQIPKLQQNDGDDDVVMENGDEHHRPGRGMESADGQTDDNNKKKKKKKKKPLDKEERDFKMKTRGHVVVIGATSRPDALDPALRRAGRFDREIAMGVPDEDGRADILRALTRSLRVGHAQASTDHDAAADAENGDHGTGSQTPNDVSTALDISLLAKRTPGYVGADLEAVCKEAASVALNRIFHTRGDVEKAFTAHEMANLCILQSDFETAIAQVQPSAQREGFASIPSVTWDDVGSLKDVKEEISFSITRPIKEPLLYESMGLLNSGGVLLYGPPGCGKTLVAKATANEAGASFISVGGPELLNKYVGESERAIRTIFARARAASPCVLFFDEIDALAPRRGGAGDGNTAAERLVNQLLTEMDGLEPRRGVYVMGATNRPDMIDAALLRPGRFGKLLFVPLPSLSGRVSILRALTRKTPMHPDAIEVAEKILLSKKCADGGPAIAETAMDTSGGSSGSLSNAPDAGTATKNEACAGWSGADVAAWVREACVCAIKERTRRCDDAPDESPVLVSADNFMEAFSRISPSVSAADRRRYELLRIKLKGS